ncbi:MAG TPA: TolC family protein [Candidatus Methylomirabilis sp.]|nr:TolC family protein [Candidatus Methylomirabilis sp.]
MRIGLAGVQEGEARRPDAIVRKLLELRTWEGGDGYLGRPGLDELKETLAQIRVGPELEMLSPRPQHQSETLELTLQKSVEIALKNNLGIRVVALAQESARLEVPRAKAKFHPFAGASVNASGSTSAEGFLVTVPGSGGTTITEATSITEANDQGVSAFITQALPTGATFTVSTDIARSETRPSDTPEQFSSNLRIRVVQPLLKGGRVYVATKPIKDAQFDLRVAEAQLKAELLKVAASTKSAYYNLLLAEKIIGVTDVAIERDKILIEASQALFKAGLVTKRDVFSAELSLAQDSARLVSARADYEVARNTLLDVLGLPFAMEVRLLDKEISFEPVPMEFERWVAAATKNRPEILALEERLAKRLLNIRVARNTLLPQLDLGATYGRTQTDPSFSKTLDFRGDVWSVGLVLSFPFGNVAARSALAQEEIERARLQEELSQSKRQIELEVRASVIKLRKSLERMKALIVAIEQAKGKLEVGRAQFALGLATNLDITDSQQVLLSADTDLLAAIVNYNIGLAELEARIAGPLNPH